MTAMPPISSASAHSVAGHFTIPESNQELSDALTRLAGHMNAAQHRFIKLLAALIEREAWLGDSGMKTPAHWLNYYCGIDLGAAREKVRVAKCLATLPLIDAAFSSGEISYSKVRAMTRSATPENEAHLLQVAQHGTAQHVEKLVRKFERAKRIADPEHARRQCEARELSWYFDDDGMLVFRGRLPAEEGAAFVKALQAMIAVSGTSDSQKRSGSHVSAGTTERHAAEAAAEASAGAKESQPAEVTDHVSAETIDDTSERTMGYVSAETSQDDSAPTYAQKRADALVALADLALGALAADSKPVTAADKYQVIIHIEAEHARNVSAETCGHAACMLESDGWQFPLAASTVRRLACDAGLVTVLEDAAGNTLNVGRRTRTIPPSIRRALTLRDHGCRFPGCCEARFVDAHHIHHWCDGGETSLDNLVLLCRHHHRLLHQENYEIVKDEASGALAFVRANGGTLAPALSPQFTETVDSFGGHLFLEEEDEALGLNIDTRTAITRWRGEQMDYGFAVGILLDLAESQQARSLSS